MKYLKITVAVLACAAIFLGAQRLLMPKYMAGIYEGALIAEYYDEQKPVDVLILGDCEVYANFSPITLWENYGITSYIRGGPQQLIWHSYYLLEDVLRREKPAVVVFNVLAMQYDTPQREGYNRLNIDGMKLSAVKLAAANASMLEGESLLSYVFPLLRFNERWSEISTEDFEYYFKKDRVSVSGFMVRCDVKPVEIIPEGRRLVDYSFGENSSKYLDKLTDLCKREGIELVLVKAPTIYPHWYAQWDAQMVDYAQEHGLIYINYLDIVDELGIDFSTDTYDAGLHLNVYGAEKLSEHFGNMLSDFVPDRRGEPEYDAIWEDKARAYNYLKETQEREIAETGKINTFTYSLEDVG